MSALRISDNEVLIASVYKEIENGYIIFLIPIGDENNISILDFFIDRRY